MTWAGNYKKKKVRKHENVHSFNKTKGLAQEKKELAQENTISTKKASKKRKSFSFSSSSGLT